jgi:hypothetical protein
MRKDMKRVPPALIGEQIVQLEWRRQNFSTYDLAEQARARRSAIYSELVPEVRYLNFPVPLMSEPDPENPTPEQLRAAHRRADKRIRAELGAALELVEPGDVATLGHLEKRLAILDRLDETIARLYKKLAYLRAIKSMAPPACQRRPRGRGDCACVLFSISRCRLRTSQWNRWFARHPVLIVIDGKLVCD